MKYLILIPLLTVLVGCCYTKQSNNNVSEYRKQYSEYANALINNTDTNLTAVLRNRLEQLKQNNLHLFK